MELLRDEEVVAINDVITSMKALERVLRAGAEEAAESEDAENSFADRLKGEADDLESKANRLSKIVRELGDAPGGPSDERIIFEQASLKLRASISRDTEAALTTSIANSRQNLATTARESLPDIKHETAREIVAELAD
ncbi:hypothetical protein [Minwuia sp.]|uniref:hypothetical protein n=1 Tax=Minwuia sp. TaxID=2493630 RepID=UPI003A954CD5